MPKSKTKALPVESNESVATAAPEVVKSDVKVNIDRFDRLKNILE